MSGIRPDNNAVGFDRIIIKPYVAGELTWVRGQYKSIHGLIVSNWKKEDGKLIMNIVIPVNTTAKVYLPSANIESIKEGRKPAVESKGLSLIGEEDGSGFKVLTSIEGCRFVLSRVKLVSNLTNLYSTVLQFDFYL